LCQLNNGPAKPNAECRRMPFSDQTHNTPTSVPPSTTIVSSCANAAHLNMDVSQFSVGAYDDFAVSFKFGCWYEPFGLEYFDAAELIMMANSYLVLLWRNGLLVGGVAQWWNVSLWPANFPCPALERC